MQTDLMKKVFGPKDFQSYHITSSGHGGSILVTAGDLQLRILEDPKTIEFPAPGHPELEFIWVLEGKLEYNHGVVIKKGEGILMPPNTPHPGKRTGKLLVIKCFAKNATLKREVMDKVVRPSEVDPGKVMHEHSGLVFSPLVITPWFSAGYGENKTGSTFSSSGHPEIELVYLLQGEMTFDNGRVVHTDEAACNLPNAPHPGKHTGKVSTRFLEVKSPCDYRLVKYLPK